MAIDIYVTFEPMTDVPIEVYSALRGLKGDKGDAGRGVQSDWNEMNPEDESYIKNKPALATVATSGNYNDLSNKPPIHNMPAGGANAQVLTKLSDTDYLTRWEDPYWIDQVAVNGTPLPTESGTANIPAASSDAYGVVKVDLRSDPPVRVVGITGRDGSTGYVPLVDMVDGVVPQPLRPKFLPDFVGATTESVGIKGAVPAPTYMTEGKYKILLDDGTWKQLDGQSLPQPNKYYLTLDLGDSIYKQWNIESATQSLSGVMSSTDKAKLDGIATGAEVNVQSDWTEADSSSDAYIRNKPVIPSKVSELTNDSGYITSYTETDPTVPSWAKASNKPTYTASEVGAVPTTRTVNGKALSSNITLTASDVGAVTYTAGTGISITNGVISLALSQAEGSNY